ncbi:XdhC family protein [Neobacillus sp. D3-1R]|uniref:XdhC family protein n=1 Tax=Neobacillus sp. D3-1R TaxID=3445778 RepID=UPI003FA11068
MESMLELLNAISKSEQKSVLATIIHVEGRAYLKEGTSMLILEDGTHFGMLSPGCLEEDIFQRFEEIINSQTPRILSYDMSHEDDYAWGRGAGCNGIIHVLIEPITNQLKNDLLLLRDQLLMGKSVLHIKYLTKDFMVVKYEFIEVEKYDAQLIPHKSGLQSNEKDRNYTFVHVYEPKKRLILFGAGNDAKPLVSLATRNGFHVILCDWRSGLCTGKNFPEANRFIIGNPIEIVCKLEFCQRDYIVIMSHDFSKDKEFLQFVLDKDVAYIGVLGPRERTERLLNNSPIPQHLYSPIGLRIGAKGPNEIATSIMAEMIKISNQTSFF